MATSEHLDVDMSALLSYMSQYILSLAQTTLYWVSIKRWPSLTDHIVFLKVTSCMKSKQSFYHIKCQRHSCSGCPA